MRRKVVVAIVALVLVVSSLLVTLEVENLSTQPISVLGPIGSSTGSQHGNLSAWFNLDRPGKLTGSWFSQTDIPFTSFLFRASSCQTAQYRFVVGLQCSGAPVWIGKSNSTADSIAYGAAPGAYELLWIPVHPNDTLFILSNSSMTLSPTAWWWV
jgi:hypothetical protein